MTSAGGTAADADLSPVQRLLVLLSVTMATSLYSMTIMIVSVVLPQVQGALAATQDQIALVVTFNLVATAVATPMAGWLVARLGRRKLMLYGLSGFTLATILCGTATSLPALVACRIAQGAFGAPLVPLAQAITLDTYPKHQHGFAQSVFGMGVVVAPAVGPILGGHLAEAYSWRWAFFLIVPLCVLALAGVWAFVHDRAPFAPVRLDWTGFLALSAAVICLQLLLDRGERLDWFASPEIALEAVGAVLAFYLFLMHGLTTAKPFLDFRLLLDRNYSLGLLLVTLYGMLNFTPMVLLPPLLQGVGGYPDSIIGMLLGMRGVGAMGGFFAAIYVGRLDPRVGMLAGFGLQAYSGWYMAGFDVNVGIADVVLTSLLQGFSVGIVWVPLSIATFATTPSRALPEATAVFHLLRNIGSSAFISISVALVIRTAKVNYAGFTELVTPYSERLDLPSLMGRWDMDTLPGLAQLSQEMGRQATMIANLNAFHLYTLACLVVMPFILLVRRPPRR